MSQDAPPPSSVGPTPEEISARLEALLKRTHALRRAQSPAGADGPTWPPPDGDLAALELVDVPPGSSTEGSRHPARDRPADAPMAPPPEGDAGASRPAPVPETLPSADDVPSFGRPDWSTLRLRETQVEVPQTPRWVWVLVAVLALALAAETTYLLRVTPWAEAGAATSAAGPVTVRLDGPPDLRVSVGAAGPALALPADVALPVDGDARLFVAHADAAPEAAAETNTAGTTRAADPGDVAPAPAAAAANRQAAPPAPTATTGSVVIESTPPGAIVTMEGRERGPTPITIDNLRPGRHEVLVVGPAGGRLLWVDVSAGETTRVAATFSPAGQ